MGIVMRFQHLLDQAGAARSLFSGIQGTAVPCTPAASEVGPTMIPERKGTVGADSVSCGSFFNETSKHTHVECSAADTFDSSSLKCKEGARQKNSCTGGLQSGTCINLDSDDDDLVSERRQGGATTATAGLSSSSCFRVNRSFAEQTKEDS